MRVHAIAGIAAAILLTGCVLSEGEAFKLKADAYLETVPENRSASVRLMTKKLRENSLEYKQFYRKLKSVLEARGYDLTSDRPAVEIKLTFGVQNTGSFSAKYGFDTPDEPHPYEEIPGLLSSIYTRKKLYSKFVKLTAVDAAHPKRELWKVKVVKEDASEDFRSAQNELLYLLSKYIETDSSEQIDGTVMDTELYQRFEMKQSAAETDLSLNAGMERKRAYEKRLRDRLRAERTKFVRCGLKTKTAAVLDVSSFGFLTEIEFRPDIRDTRIRSCVSDTVESFLPPPVGIPKGERFSVQVGGGD